MRCDGVQSQTRRLKIRHRKWLDLIEKTLMRFADLANNGVFEWIFHRGSSEPRGATEALEEGLRAIDEILTA